MHPLRTTVLLAIAQLVGATQTPAPKPTPTPTPAQKPTLPQKPTPTPSHVLPTSIQWSVAISASPAAPPVIDDDHVFIVLQSGIVSARKIGDGSPAWEVPLQTDRPLAVEGGRVYVATSDQVVALNGADGSKVWSVQSAPVTAPLVAQGGWVIAATETALTAFRSSDGSQVWSREVVAAQVMPTLEGDNLYLPLHDGRLLALDLRTGADRWVKTFVGPLSQVLALPDKVLFGTADKYFFCLHASDGELDWQPVRLGSIVRGRPVADDAHVYVASMDNTLRAYRRSNGALLWHPSVPFRPTTGPVLVDSTVVVAGNAAELRAFEETTGKPAGQITLGEALVLPPAFGKNGSATVMSAFTGALTGQSKLVLAGPPAAAPVTPRE